MTGSTALSTGTIPPSGCAARRRRSTPTGDPALARIARYNPRARFIVGLSHPALRAFSHWRMETKRGPRRCRSPSRDHPARALAAGRRTGPPAPGLFLRRAGLLRPAARAPAGPVPAPPAARLPHRRAVARPGRHARRHRALPRRHAPPRRRRPPRLRGGRRFRPGSARSRPAPSGPSPRSSARTSARRRGVPASISRTGCCRTTASRCAGPTPSRDRGRSVGRRSPASRCG